MSTLLSSAATPSASTSATSGRTARVPRTVIDEYLAEQQRMTAVETFSRWHDSVPSQARFYQSLLPSARPQPGEQYAFEVDLDRCSGCKACVTACHGLNGLDASESFRDVGLLIGGSAQLPMIQHVTSACHHCLEPACASACPVNAYEKHPVTGIVKHLDDQCFGCQYCTLACPYDVPKYHAAKGIVRKCDMCSSRLAAGEAPACVQACPHEAIRIQIVSTQQVIDDCTTQQFLPGTPEPQFTLPTTTYKTQRVFPRNLLAADYHTPRHEHAHWPLIWMLVLTQLSVGAFLVELWLTSQLENWFGMTSVHATSVGSVPGLTAFLLGALAVGAATLHLGRPLLAYRALLGLRHSWLSREILAFGLFAKLAALYATAEWWLPWLQLSPDWRGWLGLGVALNGVAGVVCSIMIYEFTRRPFWNGVDTTAKFAGTTLLLGLATVASTLAVSERLPGSHAGSTLLIEQGALIGRLVLLCGSCKLLWELRVLGHLRSRVPSMQRQSAQMLVGGLRSILGARLALGVVGGALLTMCLTSAELAAMPKLIGIVGGSLALLGGEIAERWLFFTAVVANRMPGGLTT